MGANVNEQLSSGEWARRVTGGVELKSLATTLGLYTPARDYLIDWAHGSDSAYDTLTVNTYNAGVWLDMSEYNPNMRSIVIVNEDGTSIDFDYAINFARDNIGTDSYEVAAATAETATPLQINLPATLGYDKYVQCEIRPEVGQTGTELNFKAYLVGRGG